MVTIVSFPIVPMKARHSYGHLLSFLRKQALQTLITEYLSSATWIHRYVDEVELQDKLERYVNADELDELTMALFFALSATTLHYLQWDHKIRRNWPEDSNVRASSSSSLF
jgi:hypothetical protein